MTAAEDRRASLSATAFENLKEYIDNADRAVKQDLKVWILGSIMAAALAVAVPGVGMVFYLGSISNKLDGAFQAQATQQATLNDRAEWMARRERVEESLVAWARTEGYVLSEPAR